MPNKQTDDKELERVLSSRDDKPTDIEQKYLDAPCPRCNGKGEYPSDYGSGATIECYYCDGTGKRPVINAQLSNSKMKQSSNRSRRSHE